MEPIDAWQTLPGVLIPWILICCLATILQQFIGSFQSSASEWKAGVLLDSLVTNPDSIGAPRWSVLNIIAKVNAITLMQWLVLLPGLWAWLSCILIFNSIQPSSFSMRSLDVYFLDSVSEISSLSLGGVTDYLISISCEAETSWLGQYQQLSQYVKGPFQRPYFCPCCLDLFARMSLSQHSLLLIGSWLWSDGR